MTTISSDRLPNKINSSIYEDLAQRMLKDAAEDFCRHCSNPNRQGKVIDLAAPLKNQCRCERVEGILVAAKALLGRK